MTGLEEFKQLWGEFRGLSTLVVGGSAAVPFAAALTDLAPPWPRGVVIVTAIVQFLVVLVIFHFFHKAKRRTVDRILLFGLCVTLLAAIAYLWVFSQYTFTIPTTHERHVRGTQCTANAQLVFGPRCPDLEMDDIRSAEYEAERLWTLRSITNVRLGVVALWSATFAGLAATLGSFLVYQMRKRKAVVP